MAGRLPGDLVDEARLTLDSVGRIELPPRAWPFVRGYLASIDCAVGADDAAALRTALDDLHRIGLGPRRNPDRAPSLGPSRRSQHDASSYSPTSAHRTPAPPPRRLPRSESASYPAPSPPTGGQRRRASRSGRMAWAIAACMIGILVAAGFLRHPLGEFRPLIKSAHRPGKPPHSYGRHNIREHARRPRRRLKRSRRRKHSHPARRARLARQPKRRRLIRPRPRRGTGCSRPVFSRLQSSSSSRWGCCDVDPGRHRLPLMWRRSPNRQNGPPDALPAPKEVVEFANRTVMRLVEYGGAS